MQSITRTKDNSITNETGDHLFVSQDRFLKSVVQGGACFICTRPIRSNAKEHIIPRWLQRHADIYKDTITLPNSSRFRYDQYTIPCCESCNAALGQTFEGPISQAICAGFDAFELFARKNPELVFAWLNLLMVKTHIKDLSLRDSKDLRVKSGVIGDRYNWLDFHHAHAIARAPLYDIQISPPVIGSIAILHIVDYEKYGKFDYRDHSSTDTIFLRVRDIGIISVLNDCGQVAEMAAPRVPLNAPPNIIQAAEILTEYQAASAHLISRPTFATLADTVTGICNIEAIFPEAVEIAEFNVDLFGELFWMNLQPFLKHRNKDGLPLSAQEAQIKAGTLTFLPLKMNDSDSPPKSPQT